jgi:hypothetical protein
MEVTNLKDMVKGWFVGAFSPTAYSTTEVEVGFKSYTKGDKEARHFHRIATEITLIHKGHVRMNGQEFRDGDIIVLQPMESCDFEVIENTETVVVKVPGAQNDKYLGGL